MFAILTFVSGGFFLKQTYIVLWVSAELCTKHQRVCSFCAICFGILLLTVSANTLPLCPRQSGGAGGSQHAAVLQAVRSGKSGPYTGDMALLFCCWQVNTLHCFPYKYLLSVMVLIGIWSQVIPLGSKVWYIPQSFSYCIATYLPFW